MDICTITLGSHRQDAIGQNIIAEDVTVQDVIAEDVITKDAIAQNVIAQDVVAQYKHKHKRTSNLTSTSTSTAQHKQFDPSHQSVCGSSMCRHTELQGDLLASFTQHHDPTHHTGSCVSMWGCTELQTRIPGQLFSKPETKSLRHLQYLRLAPTTPLMPPATPSYPLTSTSAPHGVANIAADTSLRT